MIDTATFKSHNPDCQYTPTIHSVLERDKLKEDEYLICLPYIQGFSFGNKRWGIFKNRLYRPSLIVHRRFRHLKTRTHFLGQRSLQLASFRTKAEKADT